MEKFKRIVLIALAVAAPQLQAQGYPNKPVRVVIGYAPGGAADAGIRPLARLLEPLLGQNILIENKPGNAGGVAMEFIAKAPNDGYTLYYFDSGPLTTPRAAMSSKATGLSW